MSCQSVFRPGLFAGQTVIVTGGFIVMREACTRWMEEHGGANEIGQRVRSDMTT
jgi:hypothetical protein